MVVWVFYDLTETITAGELIWTIIGVAGILLCGWLSVLRTRTLIGLYRDGLNGQLRLLAWQRVIRVTMLGMVFSLLVLVGSQSLSVPTNPAVLQAQQENSLATYAIMLMEIVLFAKLVIEEVIDSAIARMRTVQHAAQKGTSPRLSD